MRRPDASLAAVLLILLVVSCSQPSIAPTAADEPPDLIDTRWKVTTLRGTSLEEGPDITMEIERDRLGGFGGCNWYGSTYRAEAENFEVGMIEATQRACAERQMNEREAVFYRTLGDIASYELGTSGLVFRDDRREVVLRLVSSPRFDMDPAQLVGTAWRLESMAGAAPPGGRPVTLRLNEDTIRGHAGCRDYTGTYVAEADEVSITSLSMEGLECSSRSALEWEQQFTTELTESRRYRLQGDRLELSTDAGVVLAFDRADR